MESIINKGLIVIDSFDQYVTALMLIFVSLIGFFQLIPGDQPEKTLQKVVNLLTKFSRKPKK